VVAEQAPRRDGGQCRRSDDDHVTRRRSASTGPRQAGPGPLDAQWSQPRLRLQPSGLHGANQRFVVAFVLVSVGGGERGDSTVKPVVPA
jgi:hypothetical protein